ncbi:hypothetical protein CRE_15119 [Caenorhabditis remanei]|uniref:Reverse transcriptase domain-containing protein n=1 Tax=Caenorhabditis remanei TaxID=31234 RepID=E3NQ84_CAERE|nr:hypothetical protein CRE_15119 [Caenorhabditis remanei]
MNTSKNRTIKTMMNYWKADYDLINYSISIIDWNLLFLNLSANEMYETLRTILKKLMDSHIPCVKRNIQAKKYPKEIRKLQAKKLKVWRQEGNSDRYKAMSALIRNDLSNYAKTELENKLTSGSSKQFFQYMKNIKNDARPIGSINYDGRPVTDDQTKANVFSDVFASVYTPDDGNVPAFSPRSYAILDNFIFEPYVVEAVLLKLRPRINTTPDEIPALFLKKVATSIALPLSIIFNKSLSSGNVPNVWKNAIVIPLHKKGPKTNCSNYRPIALTSSICKTIESIVRRAIVSHLNWNNLLSSFQYGFRANRSCEAQLLYYYGSLLHDLETYKSSYAVYIDFRKAFDKISTRKLMTKLESYGIKGNMLRWLDSFLSNRTQVITLNGSYSVPKDVKSGVPQGSVLGPLLFLLFINDIGDKLSARHLMFADDLKIFSPDIRLLQEDLSKITKWCDVWNMEVAPEKCEVIRFHCSKRKSHLNQDPKLSIRNLKLPLVKSIRDLGIYFSENLSFIQHTDLTLRRTHLRINMLFNVLKYSSLDIFIRCFKIYIRPILDYGTTIFSPIGKLQIIKLESVQKSFLFRVFKKFGKEYTSYFDALEICGLKSLELRRLICDLVYIYKTIISNEIYSRNSLFTFYPNMKSLRRHPYYLRCNLKNNNKINSQYITNRTLTCWNSLPVNCFPVKVSSRAFKSNLISLDLSKHLTLSPLNY